MIHGMSNGFVEHGYLIGAPALIVTIGDERDDGASLTLPDVLHEARRNTARLVYLFIKDDAVSSALMADAVYRNLPYSYVAACFPPGLRLTSSLIHKSILRITETDIHDLNSLDERVGSISVHSWPGGPVMNRLSEVPADYGRYLVLSGDDFGQAKVWLNSSGRTNWRIAPAHPLNDLENAELCAMLGVA